MSAIRWTVSHRIHTDVTVTRPGPTDTASRNALRGILRAAGKTRMAGRNE